MTTVADHQTDAPVRQSITVRADEASHHRRARGRRCYSSKWTGPNAIGERSSSGSRRIGT